MTARSIAEIAHQVRVTASANGLTAVSLIDTYAARTLCDEEQGLLFATGPGPGVVVASATGRRVAILQDGRVTLAALTDEARPAYASGLWLRFAELADAGPARIAPPGWPAAVEVLRLSLVLGLLDGFLTQARYVVLQRARPWHEAPVETADEDPHTQARFGQAYAVRSAIAALYAECLTALEDPLASSSALDRQVATARGYADRRAGEVVNDVIGVLGASSATRTLALDRPWRELRAFGQAFPPSDLPVPTAEGIRA